MISNYCSVNLWVRKHYKLLKISFIYSTVTPGVAGSSSVRSTYISPGEVYRLANPGTIPLEINEVKSGSFLGEYDIVRFKHTYGRTQS